MGSMGRHSSWISYYKLLIIRIQLSDNSYLSDIANTKSASAHNRIRIIHIRMYLKTLLQIRIIRIRIGCGNYPHHFHQYPLKVIVLALKKY
jgi:hypothetical protein